MVAFWAATALLLSAQQAWAATVLSTYVGVRGFLMFKLLPELALPGVTPMESFASSNPPSPSRPLVTTFFTAHPLQQPETVPLSMSMRPNASFADLNDPSYTPAGYNGTTNVSQV